MKRFVFKLATLLELRKNSEERIKLLLAEKNREIIGNQEELNRYYQQLKDLQSTEKTRRSGASQVLLLRYSVAYRHKLKGDILRIARFIDDLKAAATVVQNNLMNATKARHALEIICDRQMAEWKKAYRRKEQKFIDEVAQQKFIRAHQ